MSGKEKKDIAARCGRRSIVRRAATRFFVVALFFADEDLGARWQQETRGFGDFLRLVGEEQFGEVEDADEDWKRSLCQGATDLATRFMTSREWKKRDISTPRALMFWLADFMERELSKPELAWSSSKLFTKAAMLPVVDDIVIRAKSQQEAQGSHAGDPSVRT